MALCRKGSKDKYDLDEEEIKNYFTLDNTIDGIFKTANKLFGLTFEEKFDLDLYHPDARVWEVKDNDGSHVGLYIGDYYTRSSKRGGAWMSSFKGQSNFDGKERPIIVNVCNFPPPSKDKPSLLSFEHVTTLFHEFGHGLHGLLTNTNYKSLSGTAVSRDFLLSFHLKFLSIGQANQNYLSHMLSIMKLERLLVMNLLRKCKKQVSSIKVLQIQNILLHHF